MIVRRLSCSEDGTSRCHLPSHRFARAHLPAELSRRVERKRAALLQQMEAMINPKWRPPPEVEEAPPPLLEPPAHVATAVRSPLSPPSPASSVPRHSVAAATPPIHAVVADAADAS